MKRVLLLGGTGFIGRYVRTRLQSRPDIRLAMLGHRRVDFRSLEDIDLAVSSLDRLDVEWLRSVRPDTIIHIARMSGRGRVGRRIAGARGRRANARLVDWLARHSPETHVVYVSGTLVYGSRGDDPVDEAAPLAPIAFARAYIEAERPWMDAQTGGRLPVTIVRPPWVIGPGSWYHHHYVLPALGERRVPLYGSGQNWMSFLDVGDCAGAIVHVAEHAAPGRTFNLFAPDQRARQVEFAEALADILSLDVGAVGGRALGRLRDTAAYEALTSSCRASTRHPSALDGYRFEVPEWPSMLARNLPAA